MLELRRRLGTTVLVAWTALASTACRSPLTQVECTRLLDHYTELLVREENPEATPDLVAMHKEQARRAAAEDSRFEFASCPDHVSRRSFECAMSAHSVDEVERCLIF